MIKTKDVNWLNQNYSSRIGSELNTSVTLPQLMAYLRKCLRISVNCNQNVDFDDPNYQNQLDMIVKKLHISQAIEGISIEFTKTPKPATF